MVIVGANGSERVQMPSNNDRFPIKMLAINITNITKITSITKIGVKDGDMRG